MNKVSEKKILALMREYSIRKSLIERCGGEPEYLTSLIIKAKGKQWLIPRVRCRANTGLCELCGGKPTAPDFRLHPHEKDFRSHGGRVSLDNSLMLCNKCHNKQHGIKVVDSKPDLRWINPVGAGLDG